MTGHQQIRQYTPLAIPEADEGFEVHECYACEDSGFLTGAAMHHLGMIGMIGEGFVLSRPVACLRPCCKPPCTLTEVIDARVRREDCEAVHLIIQQEWEEMRRNKQRQADNKNAVVAVVEKLSSTYT